MCFNRSVPEAIIQLISCLVKLQNMLYLIETIKSEWNRLFFKNNFCLLFSFSIVLVIVLAGCCNC